MLPEGWRHLRMGDLFASRKERGVKGLPILSVTMNDGLVDRDDLDRKQDSALSAEEHRLVRAGDIAYNTMRMWQGVSAVSGLEGIVSPAYTICTPQTGVNVAFIEKLLKLPSVVKLLWRPKSRRWLARRMD